LWHADEVQAWIGFKEKSQAGSGAFKLSAYYHTEWMTYDKLKLQIRLDGLSMDDVYGNFIIHIAGGNFAQNSGKIDIKDAVERDKKRQKLQKEISALEKKIQNEKQLNRQVLLNEELKRLKTETESI